MTSFVRGSTVTFKAVCSDSRKQQFTPTEATLSVSYVNAADGLRTKASLPMDINGSVVSASWDSSVASDSMPVTWHIRASNSAGSVAKDGSLTLTAKEANPST